MLGGFGMTRLRIGLASLLCLTAANAAGEIVYLLSFESFVRPSDGSDAIERQVDSRPLPISSKTRQYLIRFCPTSDRFDCALAVSQVEAREGKLAVRITEYDSPDVPSKILSEIDTTVRFSLGTPETFETETINALIRLNFIVEEGPDISETVYGKRERTIRTTPYYSDGKVVGTRLYPGGDQQRFADLGFEPGDIVVGFDEYRVDDAVSADLFESSLRAGKVKSVTVQRREALVTVSIE